MRVVLDPVSPASSRVAYSPEHDTSISVGPVTLTTVLELDRWKGRSDNAERIRFVVLLDTDMNEALRVQDDLRAGDPRMLRALFDVLHLSGTHNAILGYDFYRQEPRVALYPLPQSRIGTFDSSGGREGNY